MASDLDGDGSLIRRMQAGDDVAFASLVSRCSIRLLAFIKRTGGAALRADCDVDDLFQIVVFDAWRLHAGFVDRGPGSFYAWLVAVARNVIHQRLRYLDAARRGGTEKRVSAADIASEIPASITSISSRVGRVEDIDRLLIAIDGMPDRRRAVVELYHIEGATVREVSEKLAVPRSTVFDELKSAMTTLKDLLVSGAA